MRRAGAHNQYAHLHGWRVTFVFSPTATNLAGSDEGRTALKKDLFRVIGLCCQGANVHECWKERSLV